MPRADSLEGPGPAIRPSLLTHQPNLVWAESRQARPNHDSESLTRPGESPECVHFRFVHATKPGMPAAAAC